VNVIIAGAGPIAFLAGFAAKKAGFAPQVLGKFSAHDVLPDALTARVVALSPASVSLLQSFGVWEHIDQTRCAPMQAMRVWSSPKEKPLEIDALTVRAPALATIVEHCNLMRALQSAARDQSLTLRDEMISSVRSENTQMQLRTDQNTYSASALLIADASVRACVPALAESVRITHYYHSALVFNVRLHSGHGNVAFQQFAPSVSPESVIALLPMPESYATVVWSMPDSDAANRENMDDQSLAAAVRSAFPVPFGEIEIASPRSVVQLSLTQTSRWQHDRCALIGDAAHTVHPLAGQGLNLGIADVAALNLAWCQAKDPGHPLVLARYARSRAHAISQTQWVTDGLWRSVAGSWQGASPLRDAAFSVSRAVPALQRTLAAHAMGR
jgi:ubiquinone biosynthesis UbiH/UbiF/VisC/COQ6 family hydroxylase